MTCRFCGRSVKQEDLAAEKLAGTIGMSITALLVAAEVLAARVGRESSDVADVEQLARNGAGMSSALHTAAHGDYTRASQVYPHIDEWFDLVKEVVDDAKTPDPTAFDAMAEKMGGFATVAGGARWMVEHVTWGASGEVILPI